MLSVRYNRIRYNRVSLYLENNLFDVTNVDCYIGRVGGLDNWNNEFLGNYSGVSLLGRLDNETPKVKFVIGPYSLSGQYGT